MHKLYCTRSTTLVRARNTHTERETSPLAPYLFAARLHPPPARKQLVCSIAEAPSQIQTLPTHLCSSTTHPANTPSQHLPAQAHFVHLISFTVMQAPCVPCTVMQAPCVPCTVMQAPCVPCASEPPIHLHVHTLLQLCLHTSPAP